MRHKFRKYISKRGSALFMVLSVMTALIVTSMAMYFSVVSSRKTQYAIFNQQQSYQSALSLNESLLGGIIARTDDANKSGFTALSQAIDQMQVGQTITTSNNDFTSFAGASRDDEDQVGAYIADITFLCDDAEGRLFDFAVTSMINGTESTVHQYVIIPKLSSQPAGGGGVPERLFTSSGFTPVNSSVGMGSMYCDVFYDTEYAFMMPYGDLAKGSADNEAKLHYMGNVFAAGNLEVDYGVEKTIEVNEWRNQKPLRWVIRNNFKLSNEKHCTPFPDDNILNGVNHEDKTNRIIVGGDFIVESDSMGMTNVDIYVLGNVIIKGNAASKFDNRGVRLFVVGNVTDENGNPHSGFQNTYKGESSWQSASSNPHRVINVEECKSIIRTDTTSVTYYDWNTAYEDIPGIDNERDINLVWDFPTVLTWSPTDQGCTIRKITAGGSGWSSSDTDNGFKIIIDTGDDPDNVYTIRLSGYLDGGKTFSWFPRREDETNMWVLLRGRGSVRFEVPNGVNYEDWSGRTFIMHEDWLGLGFRSQNNRSDERSIKEYIHGRCGENCCKNEATVTSEECEICNLPKYKISCPDHNFSKVICKDCEGDYYRIIEENGKVYSVGTCESRVEYSKTGNAKPSVNIYLTMCGANSSITLSVPDKEMFGAFWGYIYAPFATIHFDGKQSSGKRINFLGGIACGDFNLSGMHQFIGLYPDKLPSELMSEKCLEHPLVGIDDKSWKKEI